MTLKEPFVIDLFEGKFFGAWTGQIEETDKGKRPVIRRMGDSFLKSLIPALCEKEPFHYDIHMKRNVKTYEKFGIEVKILKPTSDVPNIRLEETIWGYLIEEQDAETERLREKNQRLQREKQEIRQKLEKAKTTEEDAQRHQKSTRRTPTVQCPSCGHSMAKNKWGQKDYICEECGRKNKPLAKRQR